jgi:hypothetical protein
MSFGPRRKKVMSFYERGRLMHQRMRRKRAEARRHRAMTLLAGSLLLIGVGLTIGLLACAAPEKTVMVPRELAEDLDDCKSLAARSCLVHDVACPGQVRRMCLEAMGWERRGKKWHNHKTEIRCQALAGR